MITIDFLSVLLLHFAPSKLVDDGAVDFSTVDEYYGSLMQKEYATWLRSRSELYTEIMQIMLSLHLAQLLEIMTEQVQYIPHSGSGLGFIYKTSYIHIFTDIFF